MSAAQTTADPNRRRRCPVCSRVFTTKNGMRNHHQSKHVAPREPSIASRVIDAQLNVAMGGYADDDVAEYL